MALLREHGLSPKKAFGQNFLLDPNICRKIAEAACPSGGTVVEIGPGLGALTAPLVDRATHVVAVERDRDLAPIVGRIFASDIAAGRFEIIEGDALAFDWAELLARGPEPRALAGNLPYLLTGRLLERATEIADRLARAVFMVQLEVAERLVASAGSKEYGGLTVFVRAAFRVDRLLVVKKGAFHPRPDVDSAVVVLTPRTDRIEETDVFRELVKAAFGMRRKTLRNAWKAAALAFDRVEAAAEASGIDLGRRGETLEVEDFARVADAYAARSAQR
ncbi:MAG: ribosomal RNA small subunit methyltransferase A [Polyangiaceae bacterium]|nr:ribosomal RNA small subunit methyltransferase A [Polyangiaceae bacterium]